VSIPFRKKWGREQLRSKSFSPTSTSNDGEPSIAADNTGNMYLTGNFGGKIDMGGSTLNSKGVVDVYLASFDSNGKHRWSKNFGGTVAVSRAVTMDGNGNMYVTGNVDGSINFGGTTLTSKGLSDVYLASFTFTGKHRWSKAFGGTFNDISEAVAVDGKANVFITGGFSNSANFGGGTLTSNNGTSDIFAASYTSSGTHRWSKGFGGSSSYDRGHGLAGDIVGNMYVTGFFGSSINFGGGTLTASGKYDMFIVSLTSAGKHRWSRFHGSTTSLVRGRAIETDGNGNTYVAGAFTKTVDFGGGPLTSAGSGDIGLLKLSP